jgi:hypothetical protein
MPLLTETAIRAALAENGVRIHDDSKVLIDHYSKLADSFILAYLERPIGSEPQAAWTPAAHGQMVADAISTKGENHE